jgi:hypothetical protein
MTRCFLVNLLVLALAAALDGAAVALWVQHLGMVPAWA